MIFFSINTLSFAAGTIRVDGKVKSFSSEFIAISSGENTYYIEKKQLSGAQRKQIKNIKTDTQLALVVNFEAVSKVISNNR